MSHALTILLCMCAALRGDGADTSKETVVLDRTRWHEQAYGLSLLPPANAKRLEATSDGAIAKFLTTDGYHISVFLVKTARPVDIPTVSRQAIDKLGFAYPSAVPIVNQAARPAGRPGAKVYSRIPDRERGDWVLGQTFMQIDPFAVMVLQFECELDSYQRVKTIFEAVVASIELQSPQELDRSRRLMIEQGQTWQSTITPKLQEEALTAEQWFRVVEDDRDVGHVRIRQYTDTQMMMSGICVQIQSQIIDGPVVYDSLSEFFESDDKDQEIWSIILTRRDTSPILGPRNLKENAVGALANDRIQTWTQAGVRSLKKLTVKLETPSGRDELDWEIPKSGYISQVEVQLLANLLPGAKQRNFAFYAYDPQSRSLALRTIAVTPLPEVGGYQLALRPSPNAGQQIWTFDARGKMLHHQMADGRRFVPTTPQQLKVIHGIR